MVNTVLDKAEASDPSVSGDADSCAPRSLENEDAQSDTSELVGRGRGSLKRRSPYELGALLLKALEARDRK